MFKNVKIAESFDLKERIVLYHGSCLKLLKTIPDKSMQLIVGCPVFFLVENPTILFH